MDVLKEIKEAEKQAESIEQEYRARADALLSAVPQELEKEKTRREEKLKHDIDALRAGNRREKEKAREEVVSLAAAESASLEAQARANMPKSLDILMKALGL
jgi:vacuolar-type H+-ATPase subunit H